MSYVLLQDSEIEKIKKASNITGGDYELKGNFALVEDLVSAIEDLLIELDRAEEKYEELESDLESNYRPISYAEQVGYNEHDFYQEGT